MPLSSYPDDRSDSEPISIKEKIGYGLGDTASVLYWHTFAQFLILFYSDEVGLSPTAIGSLFLLTRVFDALNDPIMGLIADRTQSRYGRFRPWLIWMVVPYMALGVLTFTAPDFSDAGKLIYAYITYTLFGLVYTAINIPYGALMGVMTSNSIVRTQLSKFRFYGAYLAVNIVNVSMLYLISKLGGGDSAAGYQKSIMLYSLLAGLCFVVCFKLTKERVTLPRYENAAIKADLADLFRNRPWIILCILGILSLVWISLKGASILYFMKYFVEASDVIVTSFLFWGGVATMAGVYFTGHVEKCFGGKKMAFIGLTVMVGTVLTANFFVSADDIMLIFSIQLISSFLSGPLMPLFWAMIADTADFAEWKFGRRFTGLIFSVGTTSNKAGWALGSAGTAYTLAYFGYEANAVQSTESMFGIRMLMSFGPAAIAVLAAFTGLFYGITPVLSRKIEAELSARRRKALDDYFTDG
jgi:glycoside/pentoside/hexuronide:cation symporter, GPH family